MFWLFPLAGAAAGALINKKNPMQGALLGAGLGATGGAAAGGLLGAGAAGAGTAGAAGAAGAGTAAGTAAGTTAATQTAGLLGVPGAATGAGSQAAMLAAQNQGFGAVGQQLTAQAAGGASGMAVPTSVNMMAGMQRAGEALTKAKPMMDAAGSGIQAAQAVQQANDPQAPPPQMIQNTGGAESLGALYQSARQGAAQQVQQEAEVRKQRRRGLLGGV